MRSILYVDDEHLERVSVQKLLKRFGYQVDTAHSADEAYQKAQNGTYSLFLIDLILSNEIGTGLVSQLRALNTTTPIVVYSNLSDDIYQIAALHAGADDYFLKSYSGSLFAAKLHAHVIREERREGQRIGAQRRVPIGKFVLDRSANLLEADGKVLRLSKREVKLIHTLGHEIKRSVSSPVLIEKLWGNELGRSEKALQTLVKRLRIKISKEFGVIDLIENNRGRGYRINEETLSPSSAISAKS